MDEAIAICHDPRCDTSPNRFVLIRAAGLDPRVVEYLKGPASAPSFSALFEPRVPPRALLRQEEALRAELRLDEPT